ncbi:hypothetical protein quinque_004994 [Culex quinquefasciatus]
MPYMDGQSDTDGSPFTTAHSPAASNWPGSREMLRPSLRPGQSPNHKAQAPLYTSRVLPAATAGQLYPSGPDTLAEVYNCLHYFSRDATCKLNSTLQLLCDKVLEMHVTALLDTAPEFLRNRLKDVLIEVEPGVMLMFHDLDKAASHAQLGTSRVITFNTVRFIVQTFPLMASARSGKDAQILQAPLEFINLMMLRSTEFTTFYREMIYVFSAYWKHRSQIMQRISPKNEGIERIKKYLLKIVIVSLGKSIGADLLVSLFRSLNDLLVKLAHVPFD